MNILQVNKFDLVGGAAQIAMSLFEGYRTHGHTSRLSVAVKNSDDGDVLEICSDSRRNPWTRYWLSIRRYFADRLFPLLPQIAGRLARLGETRRWLENWLGREDFYFPGTYALLESQERLPDILHLHNLHGDYFDLRALPTFSRRVPTVLTLHDEWMYTGHCAYALNHENWRDGCQHCSDLNVYPAIRRDATAYNWQRKRNIYMQSRLYVTAPSQWLLQRAQQSILNHGALQWRYIPNGIDLDTFKVIDRQKARYELGISQSSWIVLFVGAGTRSNPFKDYAVMEGAIARLGTETALKELIFIFLGEESSSETIGQAHLQFISHIKDKSRVSKYYQASDVYMHAAHADTFPNTVLEALACGTPVVATGVGGIPEQVEDGLTGYLVPAGDSEAMAVRIKELLLDDELRREMGRRAAESARRRFDVRRMVSDYLDWYGEILDGEGRRVDGSESQAEN